MLRVSGVVISLWGLCTAGDTSNSSSNVEVATAHVEALQNSLIPMGVGGSSATSSTSSSSTVDGHLSVNLSSSTANRSDIARGSGGIEAGLAQIGADADADADAVADAASAGRLRGSIVQNMTDLHAVAQSLGTCNSVEKPLHAKCTGCPPMYNGKLCATTTWYEDQTKGSCGCGDAPMVSMSYWTMTSFTAALNTASLDPKNPSNTYCLAGCGSCYEICTTGGVVNSQDTTSGSHNCEVFKVTNRCADGWYEGMGPNWCSQHLSYEECQMDPHKCKEHGSTNMYGYSAHFDLQDANRQVQETLGWMNPEVTFETVSCDKWNGPPASTCPGCDDRPSWWR